MRPWMLHMPVLTSPQLLVLRWGSQRPFTIFVLWLPFTRSAACSPFNPVLSYLGFLPKCSSFSTFVIDFSEQHNVLPIWVFHNKKPFWKSQTCSENAPKIILKERELHRNKDVTKSLSHNHTSDWMTSFWTFHVPVIVRQWFKCSRQSRLGIMGMFQEDTLRCQPSTSSRASHICLYSLRKAFAVSSLNNRANGPRSSKQLIPYLLSLIKEHLCNLQK